MIPNKFSGLSILLILALLISTFAVVMPAVPVQAQVTGTPTIDAVWGGSDPTNTSPATVGPNGTVNVKFTFATGDSASYNYQVFMQQGSSPAISSGVGNNVAGQYTAQIFLGGATVGYYNVWVNVAGTVSATTPNAVYVTSTPPTVSIIAPNASTCWPANSTQAVQFSLSEAAVVNGWIQTDGSNFVPITGLISQSETVGPHSVPITLSSGLNNYGCQVKLDAVDKAGNDSGPQTSSLFAVLSTPQTPTVSTPGYNTGEVYNSNSIVTINGTITSTSPGATLSYMIGLFVNGVNTENITPGWQTVTLTSGTYPISKSYTVSSDTSSSLCKIGIWTKDCAGNVSPPGFSTNYFRIFDNIKPTGTIIWPTASSVHYVSAADNITWIQNDNVAYPNLLYTIYLSTNGGTNNTIIASGQYGQGTQSVPWSVPPTPSTNCRITENITDFENPSNTLTIYSGTFSIVQGQQPVVSSITSPTSTSQWAIGSTQTITFSASDPSNSSARLNYEIDLAADGTTFHPVTTVTNQGQGSQTVSISVPDITVAPWSFNSALLPDNVVKIQVVATNPASSSGPGNLISSSFSITAASFPVTTAGVKLYPGWNLVSLPLVPTNTNIQNVLGSAMSSIVSVWTCTGGGSTGGTWSSWSPGLSSYSGLNTMQDGKSYWIQTNITSSYVQFIFQGRVGNPPPSAPPSYTYPAGWNMVGFTLSTPQVGEPVQSYLGAPNTTSANYNVPIIGYNANSSNPAFTSLGLTDNMTPGLGYWVFYNAQGTANASMR